MKGYSYLAYLLNICQLTDCSALHIQIPNKHVCFVSVDRDPKPELLYSVSFPPTNQLVLRTND